MKIRYYVCAIGYDSGDCVTDYEKDFGDYDDIVEARNRFCEVINNPTKFFKNKNLNVAYWKVQLEKCEETSKEINCIDFVEEQNIVL